MRNPQKTSQVYLDRLETVKEYIKACWEEHHFSPANNELAAHFGVSTSVAAHWLERLEKDGWIEPREPKIARNIVPVEIFQDRQVFPRRHEDEPIPVSVVMESVLAIADYPTKHGITYSLSALQEMAEHDPEILFVQDGKLILRLSPPAETGENHA